MADPIAWGLEIINGQKTDKVQDTLDGIDFETPLENGLNEIQSALNTAITQIEEQVDGMEETINNAPIGGPLPFALDDDNFKAESVAEGIKLTYKATMNLDNASTDNNLCGTIAPYGIMIRYATDHYPRTPKDGLLAVDDTDIVDTSAKMVMGTSYGKQKSYTLVGLTSNQTYYLSAFPYSYYGMYNINSGMDGNTVVRANSQRTTCTWTGTAATLTVTITQNNDYKALGEITATLTPTAGGDPLTQSRTGAGNVVFSNVTAGEYMLSFSELKYFVVPESQEITLIAGQPNTTTAQYVFDTNLNSYTWDEISQFLADGVMGTDIPYGSKKQVKVKRRDVVLNGLTESNIQEVNVNAIFVAKNFYGGQPHCVFFTDDYVFRTKVNGYSNAITSAREGWSFSFSGYNGVVHNYLEQKYTDIFPEIASRFKEVTVGTMGYGGAYENQQTQVSCHVFYPSTTEVGHYNNPNSGETTGPFPYFNSNSRRKLASNVEWLTRSSTGRGSATVYLIGVSESGIQQYNTARFYQDNTYIYRPLCFCIG